MTPRCLLLYFVLFLGPSSLAQSYWPFVNLDARFGLYCTELNRQVHNPASFIKATPKGVAVQLTMPVAVSELLTLQFQVFHKRQRCYLFHELASVFHPANTQFRFSNGIALALGPQLQLGVALQGQLYIQPKYYGTYFQLGSRLGMTYQFNSQHFLSIVFDDLATKQIPTLRLEHLWRRSDQVQFAQGLSWNPSQKPVVYLALSQHFEFYQLQFAISLPTNQIQFGFTHSMSPRWNYQLTQSWQIGLGYMFQLTFLSK